MKVSDVVWTPPEREYALSTKKYGSSVLSLSIVQS